MDNQENMHHSLDMHKDKKTNIDDKTMSSKAFLASEEFHIRVKAYFYVAAVIVSGQLIWMLDQSIQVMDRGSIDVINQTPVSELGFTDEQIRKMEDGWMSQEFSSLSTDRPDA